MIPIFSEPAVPPKLPPHVKIVKNPAGRPYVYLMRFRGTDKAEKPVRLPDDTTSPEFWATYAAAMQLEPKLASNTTIRELDAAWEKSPEWKQLSEKTKDDWERYRARIVDSWGDLEVKGIEPKHVLDLRDRYAAKPASANNLLTCLSSMLAWSVPRGWRQANPCREIKPLKGGDGYDPWPWEAVEEAEAVLRPDLWWTCGMALYTGQRQSDVLAMLKTAISGNLIAVRQHKTRCQVWVPIHRNLEPILKAALAASPPTTLTILSNTDGQPWTSDGFKSSWGKNKPPLVKAGGFVFHGLRKSAVVTLLEAKCTDAEVAAITGQSREMIAHYAKQVNQRQLAASAILKWESMNGERTEIGNRLGNTIVSDGAK